MQHPGDRPDRPPVWVRGGPPYYYTPQNPHAPALTEEMRRVCCYIHHLAQESRANRQPTTGLRSISLLRLLWLLRSRSPPNPDSLPKRLLRLPLHARRARRRGRLARRTWTLSRDRLSVSVPHWPVPIPGLDRLTIWPFAVGTRAIRRGGHWAVSETVEFELQEPNDAEEGELG